MGAAKQQAIEEHETEMRKLHELYGNCVRCGGEVDVDHEGILNMEGEVSEGWVKRDSYHCSYCDHMANKDD